MTDFTFMVRDTSYMFVTGPNVVKTVTQVRGRGESSAGMLEAQGTVWGAACAVAGGAVTGAAAWRKHEGFIASRPRPV
jgi:hypothetical protein